MTQTTHSEYNDRTEALEVAKAFADGVRGKTVLVTGVNRQGIGYATAEAFASQQAALIIVAGRTVSKLEESIDALKKDYPSVAYRALKLNLSSQKDVRAAAKELFSWNDIEKIDIIVNSAGVMNLPERTLTEDKIETTFATNHVGHFLFTNLILSKLIRASETSSAGATRIVNVSARAVAAGKIRWSDINFDRVNNTLPHDEQPFYPAHARFGFKNTETVSYVPIEAYIQSKVANVLFSVALNNKLAQYGILSFGLHPGIIQTELSRAAPPEVNTAIAEMASKTPGFFRSQGAGASTSLVAALDPKLTKPEKKDDKENWGVYLSDCQISGDASPSVVSNSEADRLWKLSEELVGEKFEW